MGALRIGGDTLMNRLVSVGLVETVFLVIVQVAQSDDVLRYLCGAGTLIDE